MRILHIIAGLNKGGAEAVLTRLIRSDEENEHLVISMTDLGCYGEALREAGFQVHTLNMPRGRLTISGSARLIALVRSTAPDLIQTWMYHSDLIGGVVSRLVVQAPVVWCIRQSVPKAGRNSRSTRLVAWLCAQTSSFVPTRIVSCSEEAARLHEVAGYAREKIVVVPNGYELDKFQPDSDARRELRDSWGCSDDDLVLGMVARWDPQKDHQTLIAALGMLNKSSGRKWNCILVGPGMTEANVGLLELLREHSVTDRVRLLGPRSDISEIMNAIDLHLLSSIGEGFPNVVAEAMACGTPCIVTDVGDAALIVGPHGWVVPPRTPRLLASSISLAARELTDSESWKHRQVACRTRIEERFSLERMLDSYRAVWRSAER